MRTFLAISIASILAALASLAVGAEPAAKPAAIDREDDIRKEYLSRLDPNAATQMNQLGEEGWELVSITSVNFKTGATDNIAMVFKRPVAAAPA